MKRRGTKAATRSVVSQYRRPGGVEQQSDLPDTEKTAGGTSSNVVTTSTANDSVIGSASSSSNSSFGILPSPSVPAPLRIAGNLVTTTSIADPASTASSSSASSHMLLHSNPNQYQQKHHTTPRSPAPLPPPVPLHYDQQQQRSFTPTQFYNQPIPPPPPAHEPVSSTQYTNAAQYGLQQHNPYRQIRRLSNASVGSNSNSGSGSIGHNIYQQQGNANNCYNSHRQHNLPQQSPVYDQAMRSDYEHHKQSHHMQYVGPPLSHTSTSNVFAHSLYPHLQQQHQTTSYQDNLSTAATSTMLRSMTPSSPVTSRVATAVSPTRQIHQIPSPYPVQTTISSSSIQPQQFKNQYQQHHQQQFYPYESGSGVSISDIDNIHPNTQSPNKNTATPTTVPVDELDFLSFHSDAVNSGLGFDDDEDDNTTLGDSESFTNISHQRFRFADQNSFNKATASNHIAALSTTGASPRGYVTSLTNTSQQPQRQHNMPIQSSQLDTGSNHSLASRAFNFFGNRRRKVTTIAGKSSESSSPYRFSTVSSPPAVSSIGGSPMTSFSPSQYDNDDDKYSKDDANGKKEMVRRRILFQKLLSMILVLLYALFYLHSITMEQKQINTQETILKARRLLNEQKLKVPSNYRLLRDKHSFYVPNLYQPTEEMKRQFLSFQHLSVPISTISSANEENVLSYDGESVNEEEYPLIHVIKTRFMQEQSQLLSLGEARLALFNVFCLPTIKQQTTQNFIWIIKTDPNLNKGLLQQLIDSVVPPPPETTEDDDEYDPVTGKILDSDSDEYYFRGNIYVVGSNVNYRLLNTDKTNVTTVGSWKDGAEPRELSYSGNTPVYTGNQSILQWYMSLEKLLPVLETRLDADDGLHIGYIHTVQQQAYNNFFIQNPNNIYSVEQQQNHQLAASSNVKWMYWCARRHIEWHWTDTNYFSMVSLDGGSTGNNKGDDTLSKMISTYGAIQGVEHTQLCITPGITTGYNVRTPENTVPVFSHDQLYKEITAADSSLNCGLYKSNDCIQFIESFVFEAIRSRSPTSAGMLEILPNLKKLQEQHSWWVNYIFWNVLHDSFGPGITRTSLQWINKYLSNNIEAIIADNLHGQCTTGHSCKKKAKQQLQTLLKQAQQQRQQFLSMKGKGMYASTNVVDKDNIVNDADVVVVVEKDINQQEEQNAMDMSLLESLQNNSNIILMGRNTQDV